MKATRSGVLTWCDERAWYDMGTYVAGRRETCSWRVRRVWNVSMQQELGVR